MFLPQKFRVLIKRISGMQNDLITPNSQRRAKVRNVFGAKRLRVETGFSPGACK